MLTQHKLSHADDLFSFTPVTHGFGLATLIGLFVWLSLRPKLTILCMQVRPCMKASAILRVFYISFACGFGK
jgi:hypothetical protein